jgi:hypothetical protein
MLHEFIATNREEIIRRCRTKVATRSAPPTTAEIDHGVPVFLDQLVNALRLGLVSSPEISRTALQHGHDLLLQGLSVSQVVHDYGNVCQSVTELAVELDATIGTADFRTLNRCLDDAIAGAVTEYGRKRNESGIDGEYVRGSERLGFLADQLGSLTKTAILAFEVLKTGNVGVAGSTGTVLHRSLMGIDTLLGRSLAEVRLTQTIQNRERFLIAELFKELAPSATWEAKAKGIKLTVMPVEAGLTVEADRQVVAPAVRHLLQNAFRFTRHGTTVTLRIVASAERVLIEIQDECGGLSGGDVREPFRQVEPPRADQTGLGLPFSQWAVEANHGRMYARNLPDKGCVFTIDLPRLPA